MESERKHGDGEEIDLTTFLGLDPDLAMVTADMDVWIAAHPCDCEGVCVCG